MGGWCISPILHFLLIAAHSNAARRSHLFMVVGGRTRGRSSFATPTDSILMHLFGAGEKIAATRCEYFNRIVFALTFNLSNQILRTKIFCERVSYKI